MRCLLPAAVTMASLLMLTGCNHESRVKFPTTDQKLGLDRVVLYRNGVGYFERRGEVDGDVLTIKVRKDQINDMLKSLTIVDRQSGRAVSVSMPLDPQTWANAALSTLAPGRGSLAQVLDALRGTFVSLDTTEGSMEGRIVMVERIVEEPDPTGPSTSRRGGTVIQALGRDHRITLMDEQEMHVVRLSKVQDVTLQDGDLAMQFHRSLDATAGEGMFQQVDVSIRLTGEHSHDLLVSYVVGAPMWKPTYRVVLPEGGKGEALLQGWAVVDNTSGEDWHGVEMQLTSGAPLAFRYDLHTPREVHRVDMTEAGVRRHARVAVGETTYGDDDDDDDGADSDRDEREQARYKTASRKGRRGPSARPSARSAPFGGGGVAEMDDHFDSPAEPASPPPGITLDTLRRSTHAQGRATQVSGLTRFDIADRVTVPDGSSTMVAVINNTVQGEETFLFKPGGGGTGYEHNPYRVVRFKNSTPFVLEPGPIAIFSGGSFVGEGMSEAIGAGVNATIPFAVEPGIMVTSKIKYPTPEMYVIRIVRGILEVERFNRKVTVWTAKAQTMKDGYRVLIRHDKAGSNYHLEKRPEGTEDVPGAYMVRLGVPAGKLTNTIEVIERTPSRMEISIWNDTSVGLLGKLMLATNLPAAARTQLQPIVTLRQEIGKIDTTIDGLEKQQDELDERADQMRQNLHSLKKDPSPAAAQLRRRLEKRLEEFTSDAAAIGRKIVELQSQRMEKKIQVDDLLQNLDFRAPKRPEAKPSP